MVAALYVAAGGCYFGLPNVDPYDITRDARLYAGPYPVVAHPPCERWGRYWSGGPNPRAQRRIKGDDGGCFVLALSAVRCFGGVIEHPEGSHAWSMFGISAPPAHGGWVAAGDWIGWTCRVDQGNYGHPARKATWLYANAPELPSLNWARCKSATRLDEGFHSAEQRRQVRAAGIGPIKRLNEQQKIATPLPFRDLLISIAESANDRHVAVSR
jgi:hypothetical protein